MISIDEALNSILSETVKLSVEKVSLRSALGRVLAEDIKALDSLPPFDKSAMDGYALWAEDTEEKQQFTVCGTVPAGSYFAGEIMSGQAIKIMTGAPLPHGTNTVIQIEKVTVKNDVLFLEEKLKPGLNVLQKGEEIRAGETALYAGTVVRPTEIGVLASLGYDEVRVYRKPKVALLITGDELVPITEKPGAGKIRNSNEYSLMALIDNAGAEFISWGIIPDQLPVLRERMRQALNEADVILTTGGASVGDYDFVEDVLQDVGAEIKFGKVAIKPGKPLIFAVKENKLFFGLPGNPMAVINTFEQFVKPALYAMTGRKQCCQEMVEAVAGDDFKAKKGRSHYIYVRLVWEDGRYVAYKLNKKQSSNYLLQMSKANGIIIIPADKGSVSAGEILKAGFLF